MPFKPRRPRPVTSVSSWAIFKRSSEEDLKDRCQSLVQVPIPRRSLKDARGAKGGVLERAKHRG